MKHKKVVVIGGGFAGLAAAALAAQAGHQVTLLEKNTEVGGRARSLKKKGFTFDMGPSWYLMPEVFERFFGHFNTQPNDFYKLKRLNPRYRVAYEDGSQIDLQDDLPNNIELFEKLEPGAGKALDQYLDHLEKRYHLIKELLYVDIFSFRQVMRPAFLFKGLSLILTSNLWQSWHDSVKKIVKHDQLQKILEFPAVFLGGSPMNTPALFTILSWAEFKGGVWYPSGGMKKVVDAIVTLAKKSGVKIVTGANVTKINVQNGRVVGVKVGKTFYPADAVIAAADLAYVETQLLDPHEQTYPPHYWQAKTPAISAVCIYLGINKKLPQTPHHLLYLTDKWEEHFQDIFSHHRLPQNPSFYVSLRSMSDRQIVPPNAEELFILVPVASAKYGKKALDSLVSLVLEKVEKILGQKIQDSVVVKEVFGPQDFVDSYHAFQGTALGLAPTLSQSLWGRPGVVSKKVKGLLYAGQFSQPGVGVPMALISAELAVRRLNETS